MVRTVHTKRSNYIYLAVWNHMAFWNLQKRRNKTNKSLKTLYALNKKSNVEAISPFSQKNQTTVLLYIFSLKKVKKKLNTAETIMILTWQQLANPQNHQFVWGKNPPTRHWFNDHSTLIHGMNNTNLQYIFFQTAWDFFADNHSFFAAPHPKPHSLSQIQTKCIFAINMYHKVVALKMSCLNLLS